MDFCIWRRTCRLSRCVLGIFSLVLLVACGGGGGSAPAAQADEAMGSDTASAGGSSAGVTQPDATAGTEGSDPTSTDTGGSNVDSGSTDTGQEGTAGQEVTDGNDTSGAVIDTPTDTTAGQTRQARLVIKEGRTFTQGIESINRLGRPLINRKGDVAFNATVYETECCEQNDKVFVGTVFGELVVSIQQGDAVTGVAPTLRISEIDDIFMGPSGRVLALVTMDGSSTFDLLAEHKDGAVVKVLSEGDSAPIQGDAAAVISDIISVDHNADKLALTMKVSGLSPEALFVDTGAGPQFVAASLDRNLTEVQELQLTPLLADGCRVRYSRTGRYGVDQSGALYFDAALNAETPPTQNEGVCARRGVLVDEFESNFSARIVGSNAGSIIRYTEADGFVELLSAGDNVPGISDAVFKSVSIGSISDTGLIYARATIAQPSTGETFDSRWLVSSDAEPRLVMLEGETFESIRADAPILFSGTQPFSVSSSGLANTSLISDDGYFASTYNGNVIAGYAHPDGSPYSVLPVSGTNPIRAIAVENGLPFDGFSDTAFISSAGDALPFVGGRTVFQASITDVDDESKSASGYWLHDASGDITKLVGVGDVVQTDTLPVIVNGFQSTPKIIDDDWLLVNYGFGSAASGLLLIPLER